MKPEIRKWEVEEVERYQVSVTVPESVLENLHGYERLKKDEYRQEIVDTVRKALADPDADVEAEIVTGGMATEVRVHDTENDETDYAMSELALEAVRSIDLSDERFYNLESQTMAEQCRDALAGYLANLKDGEEPNEYGDVIEGDERWPVDCQASEEADPSCDGTIVVFQDGSRIEWDCERRAWEVKR